jgi:cellulose synthase/poly-beta-1,6-N-acetylglucosamine synthase-like glycosyltransferase
MEWLMNVMFWILYFVLLYITVVLLFLLVEADENKTRRKRFRTLPKVSVIVPAYNEEKTIGDTLRSLLSLDYPKNKMEIIVVNDGSTDRTREIVKSFEKDGVRLLNQKNRGKGACLNRGLKLAKGEYVACLDADSFVERDTLKNMIPYFYSEKVGAVTPVMKIKNPKTLLQKIQWFEYILYIYLKKILEQINSIHVTPGPFTIYRKSVVEGIGGFDETSIVEDQEIAYRLQKHQYRIVQSDRGDVFTIAPRNIRRLYKQRSRWFRGTLITLFKYRDMVFNRKYGDFGMYQLPSLMFSIFLFVFILLFFGYYMLLPLIQTVNRFAMVNFAVTIKPSMEYVFSSLFYVDYAKFFIIAFFFVVSIVMMVKAHREVEEGINIRNSAALAAFFIVYYILMSFIWLASMIELAVYRKRW